MPVTARLSKRFYDRFGDDIAGEFVDWFNAVDSTYQQQLRDLNDLNWERFKAELHSAIAQSEARMIERMTRLEVQNGQLEARVASKFSEMMKWMFIYWSGTVLSLGGLMIALSRK
ncbi:MAG: hypothetical protein H0W63_02310 [Gemmatimonadaceae bacterium]|nr:hypothetical protein [Gemmatimonadaceae bacterium]